jgi:hypothetical protein
VVAVDRDTYAAIGTPETSGQVVKAWLWAERNFAALSWLRVPVDRDH